VGGRTVVRVIGRPDRGLVRTVATAVTTALTCLLTGAALSGCGAGATTGERSADQMLDDANATMRALTSVTVDVATTTPKGATVTSHLVTDLDDRCRGKTTWSEGGSLEQIRIGETDYVRPDRTYLQKWSGDTTVRTRQNLWAKTPASQARPDDGLTSCTHPFTFFGTAKKGETTSVNGGKALALIVTDDADKEGTYTFYVATEGQPYLLKTVYSRPTY
jgi:hypothetical protein